MTGTKYSAEAVSFSNSVDPFLVPRRWTSFNAAKKQESTFELGVFDFLCGAVVRIVFDKLWTLFIPFQAGTGLYRRLRWKKAHWESRIYTSSKPTKSQRKYWKRIAVGERSAWSDASMKMRVDKAEVRMSAWVTKTAVWICCPESLRVPLQGSSTGGESGPKA